MTNTTPDGERFIALARFAATVTDGPELRGLVHGVEIGIELGLVHPEFSKLLANEWPARFKNPYVDPRQAERLYTVASEAADIVRLATEAREGDEPSDG